MISCLYRLDKSQSKKHHSHCKHWESAIWFGFGWNFKHSTTLITYKGAWLAIKRILKANFISYWSTIPRLCLSQLHFVVSMGLIILLLRAQCWILASFLLFSIRLNWDMFIASMTFDNFFLLAREPKCCPKVNCSARLVKNVSKDLYTNKQRRLSENMENASTALSRTLPSRTLVSSIFFLVVVVSSFIISSWEILDSLFSETFRSIKF